MPYLSMAFKREGILSRDLCDVMDPHPPFNAANGKACRVREARYASGLVLKGGLLPHRFAGLSGTVVGQNMPSGRPDHEKILANIHGVHALGKINGP
jgi:hypothetical protein